MTRNEIETIVRYVARYRGLECKFPLEVYGSKDVGVRYRYTAGRRGEFIPKAMFAVSEADDDNTIRAKAATAADALHMGVTTGWNKVDAPLNLKGGD